LTSFDTTIREEVMRMEKVRRSSLSPLAVGSPSSAIPSGDDGPIVEFVQSDESLPSDGTCPKEEEQSGDDPASAPAADV